MKATLRVIVASMMLAHAAISPAAAQANTCGSLLTRKDSVAMALDSSTIAGTVSINDWEHTGLDKKELKGLRMVVDSAVCAQAFALIRRNLTEPYYPYALRIARMGKKYVAFDKRPPAYSIDNTDFYVMDINLKRLRWPRCPKDPFCKQP